MESDREDVAREKLSFARALDSLKAGGSNVLLVGETTRHDVLCRRLDGDSTCRPRYRLFVSLDPTGEAGDGRAALTDGHADATRTQTLSYAAIVDRETDGGDPLGRLGAEIVTAVDGFDEQAGGVSAGQLRVCIDGLEAATAAHDVEGLFRLLHAVTSRVKHAAGMGHVHIDVDSDDELVSLFEPLFDATVDVRASETGYEQRWHLRDEDASSGWIPVRE
ncbi:hypothetical protein OB905_03695 [Halobacteria archaeon AArc-dxtr1]|nr:hypothetical protein [Halobacteria archaeon AArc-dxtr1]